MKKFGIVPLENKSWKPLVIATTKKAHAIKKFKKNFMISRVGNICMCGNGIVYRKYWHNNRWYVDIYGTDGEHINQTLKTLIKNSWGKAVAAEYQDKFVA